MHFKRAKGILSSKNGMNLYRGCTHGCIYCDSRSHCYQMPHLFEDIEVKENAIELLENSLRSKKQKSMISTGAMTDPYLHLETDLRMTHQALKIIYKYGFGVTLHTKSSRVLDDLDLLKQINKRAKVIIQMTLTTYDETLCKIIEPNVSTTKERFNTLLRLHEAGIDTVVWLSPFLPFINDTVENVIGLMEYLIKAHVKGVVFFGAGVTLRSGNRDYFYKKLDQHFPGLKETYMRTFKNQYECHSINHKAIKKTIESLCQEHGIMYEQNKVFDFLSTLPPKFKQVQLF